MNNGLEESTRVTHEFPVLGKVEIYSLPKRKKIFLVCTGWAAFLMMVLCAYGLSSYHRNGQKEASSVYHNSQYRSSVEEMIRKDFEKWSAEKLRSFENRLQTLQMKADMIQGRVEPETQRMIDRLERMQALAQARFSSLQNAQGEIWNEARKDMNAILGDLEKAYHRAATQLMGP